MLLFCVQGRPVGTWLERVLVNDDVLVGLPSATEIEQRVWGLIALPSK